MNIQEKLCKAFCNGLEVRKVLAGYVVTTPFMLTDKDPIVFYVIADDKNSNLFHIEDDGRQVPMLEASGIDFGTETRGEAFHSILAEYGLIYDAEKCTLMSDGMPEDEIAIAALKFVAAILRLQDFILLHPKTVRSTFREDAISAFHKKFDGVARVTENAKVSDTLSGYPADIVVTQNDNPPLAVYLGTSDERALLALVMKAETEKYQNVPCKIILLVEYAKRNPLREPTYALSQARLDEVLSFRGVEEDTMNRINQRLLH